MGNIGMGELVLIFLVILLVFGAKRIPEIARGLGQGLREFKTATREIQRELTIPDQTVRITPPPRAGGVTVESKEVASASGEITLDGTAKEPA
jgi:sec-independent protein translocase protein TatA